MTQIYANIKQDVRRAEFEIPTCFNLRSSVQSCGCLKSLSIV